jgi:branched-subunit amino acid ABC-type transport system permease component
MATFLVSQGILRVFEELVDIIWALIRCRSRLLLRSTVLSYRVISTSRVYWLFAIVAALSVSIGQTILLRGSRPGLHVRRSDSQRQETRVMA